MGVHSKVVHGMGVINAAARLNTLIPSELGKHGNMNAPKLSDPSAILRTANGPRDL